MARVIVDTEVYPNYFFALFKDIASGKFRSFEMYEGVELDRDALSRVMRAHTTISFNGLSYDLYILAAAIKGASCAQLKALSDEMIKSKLPSWRVARDKGVQIPRHWDHIDIIEVAPGSASLKVYGGRMHATTMQDLPIAPDDLISPAQRDQLRVYCKNDVNTTEMLYRKLELPIALREQMSKQYDIDLRSKSDAQIAEAVIKYRLHEYTGRTYKPRKVAVGHECRYEDPKIVSFQSEELQKVFHRILKTGFPVGTNGAVTMPKELADAKIKIGAGVYRMGIGGLHSSEKSIAHFAGTDTVLIDRDVASYYPAIILRCGLTPESLAPHFLPVYRGIVEERLAAKKSGDKVKADALKITINGSFGKFGSPYSILYSPSLLIQVTVTGQLCLLMLIEMIEQAGAQVVSANTDGIVIKAPRRHLPNVEAAVRHWEMATGFDTEATEYRALYSRDVNNYIAVKPNGSVKLKGAYAEGSLSKAPSASIATGAVVKYLVDGTPIDETIAACQDIRKFVCARNVKGGAVKDGQPLGRVARWYYALGELDCIRYAVNNYTVPRTEGACPLMTLPASVPADLDREWYVLEARSILRDIGAPQ
jgi:hypothetical protein